MERTLFAVAALRPVTAFLTARAVRIQLAAVLATATALTAAGGEAPPRAPASSTDAGTPSAPVHPATSWRLGATPLPLRRDGYGMVLPTPPELRDRRLPTIDRLPPPASGRFEFALRSIDQAIQAGMPWHPDCPVELKDLRYVMVSFWGFDGRPHTGELVIHQRVVDDIVRVLSRLYEQRFPIEEMRLITAADIAAPPTGDGNNSAAFLCRPSLGRKNRKKQWSAHAYGVAIDLNPFQNPYAHRSLVLPELAAAYLERSWVRPGMIRPGDVVTQAFAEIGWTWGGTWQSRLDYMHFSATGK